MIAVDTNILVHAHRRASPWHVPAAAGVARLAEHAANWLIPWPCVHEFISTVTHSRIFANPSTLEEAIDQVEAWMESPTLVIAGESRRSWLILREQARAGKVAGPQIHDARIAAICLDHGVTEFWSADRDFSRFPRLRVVNPLISQG